MNLEDQHTAEVSLSERQTVEGAEGCIPGAGASTGAHVGRTSFGQGITRTLVAGAERPFLLGTWIRRMDKKE